MQLGLPESVAIDLAIEGILIYIHESLTSLAVCGHRKKAIGPMIRSSEAKVLEPIREGTQSSLKRTMNYG